jgi:signal peptidase II
MFWIIVVSVIVLDQISKYLITHSLVLGASLPVIPNFLHFTYTLNTGASFSIFQGQRPVFIILTLIVLAFVFWAVRKIPRDMKMFRFFLALFCGGTIGNLIDRLYLGAVIDFVNLGWFPIFNVADSCICVSAIMICALLLFGKPGNLLEKKKEK